MKLTRTTEFHYSMLSIEYGVRGFWEIALSSNTGLTRIHFHKYLIFKLTKGGGANGGGSVAYQ